MRRLVAALVAVSFTGCSFALVRGPGDVENPPRVYPDCTDSLAWPVTDGILGLLFLAVGANADGYDSSTDTYSSDTHDQQVASGLITAAAFVASAVYGYTRVSSCREARDQFTASAPQQNPYGYPGQYPQPYPGQQPYPYPGQQPYPYPSTQPQPYPSTQPQPYPAQPQPYPSQPQPYPPQQPQYPTQVYPQQPQGPQPGSEGGTCMANNACNTGLVCASNLCVRPVQGPPGGGLSGNVRTP